ncbi:MAG: AMP-binding protein, partial [Ilumatobacteraceae bacterium]
MYPGAFRQSQPDKPALIMSDRSFVQTYAELDAAANRFSQALREAGLEPGDHLALCLENHPRYLELLWGCHYAGLIYTAISSRLNSEELAYIVNDCGAMAYITSRSKAEQAEQIADSVPDVTLRLMLDGVIDGFDSYEESVARYADEPLDARVA